MQIAVQVEAGYAKGASAFLPASFQAVGIQVLVIRGGID